MLPPLGPWIMVHGSLNREILKVSRLTVCVVSVFSLNLMLSMLFDFFLLLTVKKLVDNFNNLYWPEVVKVRKKRLEVEDGFVVERISGEI